MKNGRFSKGGCVISQIRVVRQDKRTAEFTVIFAFLRTVWHHSREHMAFTVQVVL